MVQLDRRAMMHHLYLRTTRFWILLAVVFLWSPPAFSQFLDGFSDSNVDEEVAETITEPALQSGNYVPAAKEAAKEVGKTYQALFERRDREFGPGLIDSLVEDGQNTAADAWDEYNQDPTSWLLDLAPASLATVLILLLLVVLDRNLRRFAVKRSAERLPGTFIWLHRFGRTAASTAIRVGPALVAALAAHFVLRAFLDQAEWFAALTHSLWIFVLYRLAHGAVLSSFGHRVFEVGDDAATRLMTYASWTLKVFFGWWFVLTFVRELGARDELGALVEIVLGISLILHGFALFFLKDEIVELLADGTPEHQQFTAFAQNHFRAVVGLAVVLLVVALAGYVAIAKFVLIRGALAIGVIFGSLRIGGWLHERIDAMAANSESRDETALITSIGSMLRVIYVFVFIGFFLKLFELFDPLMTILGVTFLTLGGTSFSIRSFLEALIFLGAAVFLGKVIRAVFLKRVFPVFDIDVGVGYAINTLVNYAIIVIGFIVALIALGVNVSAMTVVIASLGVGIGLGLQTLTENLVSGFILLFGRSVKKGDVITVNNVYGRVEEVGARSVVIQTPDNYDMLIPSKQIVNGDVINWSYRDSFVRMHLPVGVSYSAKPRHVEEILLAAAREHPAVETEPGPEVWLNEFGDSSVNFALLVYFDTNRIALNRLRGQLNFIVWDKLHEAGIGIPFPQRDLHVRSGVLVDEFKAALSAFETRANSSEDMSAIDLPAQVKDDQDEEE